MKKSLLLLFATLLFASVAYSQDAEELESTQSKETSLAEDLPVTESDLSKETLVAEQTSAVKPGGPKTMSGMSILGNEETPKSLVIVPWKSSEMGDELSLSDTLDERARPVDKEVFLRELNFYQIQSGEE
jgi:hypothetical protein